MEIRYTITLEDYREGNRLWLLHSTFPRKLNYLLFVRSGFWVGLPLFCIALILFFVNLTEPRYPFGGAVSGIIAAAAWIGAICVICPLVYRRKTARSFREQKLACERILKADDSGIFVARTDGTSESRLTWAAFDKAVESDETFVIFPNLRTFVAIPRRAMTAEQQQEFRALLAAHVPGSASPALVAGR